MFYRECVKITEEDDEWFCQMCENLNSSESSSDA